ncbi:hypothetical protein quinque_013613 [Culex quinquefasciatus]
MPCSDALPGMTDHQGHASPRKLPHRLPTAYAPAPAPEDMVKFNLERCNLALLHQQNTGRLFIVLFEKKKKLLSEVFRIQSYDIELEYRKGKQNITADCLSRSLDAISVAQVDPEYQDLVKQITMDPQAYTDFRVVDGSVYKFVKNQGKVEDSRFCWKVYPPKSEREEILRKTHGTAHLGFEKTLAALRERYFWPLMNTETKRFCQDCLVCQTSKATNVNTTAPLKVQRKIAEYPWQFVTMDYVGPLPASGKGSSTCLLVLTDVFSKFVLVQPFRQATADSLVPFVENMLFLLFGVPEVILTDNGTQFTSKLFQDLLSRYHVTHWRTPSYHPQINDSERANRVITTAIRATIKKDHKDWANNIQTIANAIRNSVHDATKYTPYFVLFGRNMVSDGREYRCMRDTSIDSGSLNNAEREKLYADVKENLKKAFERHSKYYNLRSNAKCPQYTVNEKVLKKNTELSDKEWSTRIARNDMIKLLFKNNPEKPPEIEELGEEGVGTVQMCVGVSADPFAVRNYYPPRGRFLTWA